MFLEGLEQTNWDISRLHCYITRARRHFTCSRRYVFFSFYLGEKGLHNIVFCACRLAVIIHVRCTFVARSRKPNEKTAHAHPREMYSLVLVPKQKPDVHTRGSDFNAEQSPAGEQSRGRPTAKQYKSTILPASPCEPLKLVVPRAWLLHTAAFRYAYMLHE